MPACRAVGSVFAMRRTNRNYSFATAFADALATLGLKYVCVSPGSRSSPLAMAFASHPDLVTIVHLDERSSGFFAIGIAKATGQPVAVVTTSGTAAAELLPAAVEALHARVPLLLLTADRPPELRHTGSSQTIDQVKLYGSAVKWSHEPPLPEASPEAIRATAALASHAFAVAGEAPAGPVHLNLAFREPLVPVEVPKDVVGELPRSQPSVFLSARLDIDDKTSRQIVSWLAGKRALVLAGTEDRPGMAGAIEQLAASSHMPVLADPFSGVRAGPHDHAHVIAHADCLAQIGMLERHPPEALIRFGGPLLATSLSKFLATNPDIPQIVVDEAGWRDPTLSSLLSVRADPALAAGTLAKAFTTPAPADWVALWREANRKVAAALDASGRWGRFPSEPAAVLAIAAGLPEQANLWVGSSLPIRHVDFHFPSTRKRIRFLAHRGTNGIDGFLSAGLGTALVDPAPTYLLGGDLTVLYDITALEVAARMRIPVTIIVLNNNGGGIFSHLPQSAFPDHFERLFGTPHGLGFRQLAAAFKVPSLQAESFEQLRTAVASPATGPRLIEIVTDRENEVLLHHQALDAARRALGW